MIDHQLAAPLQFRSELNADGLTNKTGENIRRGASAGLLRGTG